MSEGEICARHYATGKSVRLRWQHGKITHLEPAPTSASDDLWLAPALFDPQINGYGGIDFQKDELTTDDLLSATRQLRAAGCTRFLLTLITDAWPKLTARLHRLRNLRSQSPELESAIVGWHMEGPFLSPEPGFHGAHEPALMLSPTAAHVQELRAITGNDPLLLTMAPERPGTLEAIACATALGIKVSLGHTNASAETLGQAVSAGATGFTHLGNGCPRELDRHDNILWRVLETPGLTVSLIPDLIHVSPAPFRLIHRLLRAKAIYYTTDAMAAAGAPPGRYRLGRTEVEVGPNQIVRQPGKTNFAGSALRPIDGVFRAARMLNRPWQEVWDRSSRAPADLLGLVSGLEPGEQADFCLLKISDADALSDLKVYASGKA
ncbi:MAG: N-acetylglucosamine-6-phosphate deacetylase [Pedosphaera sp.]|nr:N-acetylglucosamine-6-phosphate deacetylase [Pedosphaera sp.]